MLSRKTFGFKPTTFNHFGFTLLELLVVMAIIAILTAMSMPAISGYLKGARLKGGARQIVSALRMARQLAITKRDIYSVDFNTGNRQFWVEWDNQTSGSVDTLVDEIRTLPDTINFDSSQGTYLYDFSARGTVGSGSIYIVDPNNNYKRISVVAATGQVKVQNYP